MYPPQFPPPLRYIRTPYSVAWLRVVNYAKLCTDHWITLPLFCCLYLNAFHQSNANSSQWLVEREQQSRQICRVSRCSHLLLRTAGTRLQRCHLWWSAAMHSYCHRNLSRHPNLTPNQPCRNSSCRCSQMNNILTPLRHNLYAIIHNSTCL